MFETVRESVAQLQNGRLTAADLLEQCIAQIVRHDGALNAVAVRDFERARLAARAADHALARGERRPLLGIPMTVKEAINVAGLPTTWGMPGTETIPVREDALVVQRLKAAGAIVIGKTNVAQQLADWQCDNPVYGTTNNPWNPALTPGGSSGGSAAALAAGFVPLEVGTDMGGSLRVPAHCCGVYAHKPTHGLVPMRGIAPPGMPALPTAPPVDFAVVGPMARSAGDLALALDLMAGPDEVVGTAYRLALPPARHVRLADFRVLMVAEHPYAATGSEVSAALHATTEKLARIGCRVGTHSPSMPDLAQLGEVYTLLLMAFLGANLPEAAYQDLQEQARRLPPDARTPSALQMRGLALSHRGWIQSDRARHAIANQWRELFREWDVVLCPIWPTPAFAHDHSPLQDRRLLIDGVERDYGAQSGWISLATLTGLPATAVPIGLGASGLPIGIQVIGPYLEDRTTLAFAEALERELGGFMPPPGFGPGSERSQPASARSIGRAPR